MIIDAESILYLSAAIARIDAGRIPPENADICSECDRRISRFDDNPFPHLLHEKSGSIFVLIGCEGYHQLRDYI